MRPKAGAEDDDVVRPVDEVGEPRGEAELRAAIEAIERRRIDPSDARLSFYQGIPGGILLELGRAWVFGLEIAILVIVVALTISLDSWPVAAAGLVLLALVSGYAAIQLDDWVDEHNDRLDDQLRALLAGVGRGAT